MFGYINMDGDLIIPAQFTQANDFEKGTALVTIDKKFGLIDKAGTFIVPCSWTDVKQMQNGLLKVNINDKMAYYNLKTRNYFWQEEGFGK